MVRIPLRRVSWFKLQGGGQSLVRHVTIDDLSKRYVAIVRHEVEDLALDAGRSHDIPFLIVPRQFGIRSGFGIFGDGSYGRRAVDGLFSACDISQTREKR